MQRCKFLNFRLSIYSYSSRQFAMYGKMSFSALMTNNISNTMCLKKVLTYLTFALLINRILHEHSL